MSNIRSGTVELFYAGVSVIGHINVAGAIEREVGRRIELAITRARGSIRRQQGAATT